MIQSTQHTKYHALYKLSTEQIEVITHKCSYYYYILPADDKGGESVLSLRSITLTLAEKKKNLKH